MTILLLNIILPTSCFRKVLHVASLMTEKERNKKFIVILHFCIRDRKLYQVINFKCRKFHSVFKDGGLLCLNE